MAQVTDTIMLDSTGQDIKDQISALNAKIQTLNTLLADLGLVSITPISQQDYDALSQAEKLAGVFDIYDAAEPNIDGTKVSYDSNTNIVEKIDNISNWTFVGSQTGNTDVSLPSTFNELVIFAHEANDYSISFTWHIINKELATTKRSFRQGYYLNSSDNGSIIASVSKTLATISSYAVGATSYLERITFEVYAR